MLFPAQSRTPPPLSGVPYTQCPAKTYQDDAGNILPGRTVIEHCQIVGEVTRAIIACYPNALQALFPPGSILVAGSHDVGKVSPCFYEKIRRTCTVWGANLPSLPNINPELESQWGFHGGVSQVTAKALNAPEHVPEILGQHHGFSPPDMGTRRANDEVFGGPAWQTQRKLLLDDLMQHLGCGWPQVASISQARLLAGLTTVADWVGSGDFFEDPALPWQNNIAPSLDAAGFIPPRYQPSLSFQDIFGFAPRSAQEKLIKAVDAPGVYVLEAPMGLGKTEAALYAAYRMLTSGQASGIYFALPTQLTSNKLHERFCEFLRGNEEKQLQGILAASCPHRALLLHSSAWLQKTAMGEEGLPGRSWFNHAKRGLLAPFAVGTLDQALMATMNVKHGCVRAFGLAGKVVILDEVHTYDAYTGTLLDALVELLRDLRCTVIILSATLNRERRKQLLLNHPPCSNDYPLISALPEGGDLREHAVASSSQQTVTIHLLTEERQAIEQALERAEQGQQVLWIENTVDEAQQRYLDLAARAHDLGIACGLLHSRFTMIDRQKHEDKWIALLGKGEANWARRVQQGRIVVGTQVLEQSLDIDADFLVSRFAPTDMLLQRLGRLWRHHETPRPQNARAEAWLLAPNLQIAIENPQTAFGKTANVYSPYILCRSLEVWQARKQANLPEDIRPLIEATYTEREESDTMARWLYELENGVTYPLRRTGRKALRQLARIGLANEGKTLPENKAETRYSETESVEVLLVRHMTLQPNQKGCQLTLLNGEKLFLPQKQHSLDKEAWRKISAQMMSHVVKTPLHHAPLPVPVANLKKLGLHHCFYLGSPEADESLLRVALVDNIGGLHSLHDCRIIHDKYTLDYRDDLGYRAQKRA
jgi:CRISPR-associated endonuclease/helicase Cas3